MEKSFKGKTFLKKKAIMKKLAKFKKKVIMKKKAIMKNLVKLKRRITMKKKSTMKKLAKFKNLVRGRVIMENLLNLKAFKKLGMVMLPVAMLLVTLVPGSLWGANCAADDELSDTKSWVGVLGVTTENAFTYLSNSSSQVMYVPGSTGGKVAYKDHTGNGDANGSIAYVRKSGDADGATGGRPRIQMHDVDITTSVGLLDFNGQSGSDIDDYDVELSGKNVITSTGESAIRVKDSKIKFCGHGSLTIYQSGGKPAINASTADSGVAIEDLAVGESDDGWDVSVTIIQTGEASPALVSKGGNLEINDAALSITQETAATAFEVPGDIILKNGKMDIKYTNFSDWKNQWWKAFVGESEGNTTEIIAKGEDMMKQLTGKGYKYIKLSKTEGSDSTGGGANSSKDGQGKNGKDGLPKTGDSAIMILPVLLVVAGAFIAIVANKKEILEK